MTFGSEYMRVQYPPPFTEKSVLQVTQGLSINDSPSQAFESKRQRAPLRWFDDTIYPDKIGSLARVNAL